METTKQDAVRGARFKEARLNLGLSQSQLAKELGVSSLTVSLWERGVTFPRPQTVAKVAELLGVSILYLRGQA